MTTLLLFDTHAAIKDLIAAGIVEKEAEAIVKVMNSSQGELATKGDLETGLRELGQELRADLNLLRWMVGFNLALTAAGVVALLFR